MHTFPRSLALSFLLVTLPSLVLSLPNHPHDHSPVPGRIASRGNWWQDENHHAHALFKRGKRDDTTDGTSYATVGSPQWASGYPQGHPDPNNLPQEWTDALNAAIQAGKIPNIAPSTATGGNPTYGNLDPMSDAICSTTYKCRKNNDTWDAPTGVFGASFDDGPLPTSDKLYDFLKENDVHATHFFIGINILNNPKEFTRAFEELGDDIAVHTWTHPYMTTLTNAQLLGEFGWTMEIIHNSTGGRLPKYWRPPYGDSDNRVSAIAKEIFGLHTIIWNQDTEDWSIGNKGGATFDGVQQSLTKWLTGPKSPGLIILEHELTNDTVSAFIQAYPQIKGNGWNIVSVAELDGESAYWNADGDDGTVTPADDILQYGSTDDSSSSSASSSSSSSSASSSAASPAVKAGSAPSGTGTSSGSSSSPHSSGSSGGSSSSSPAPTGAAQHSGARSLVAFVNDLSAAVLAVSVLFLSAVALA